MLGFRPSHQPDGQAKRLAEMQNNEEARVEGQVKQKEAASIRKDQLW